MLNKDEEQALQADNKHFMYDDVQEHEKMAVIMFYVALIAIVALVIMWVISNG